jgi:hypothetical protein
MFRAFEAVSVLLAVSTLAACAYPRRSTSLSPSNQTETATTPDHTWDLEVVSAVVPPRQRSGSNWDDGEDSQPDPFVRIYRSDELLWESESRSDTLEPRWGVHLPRNVRLPPEAELRIELWDRDRAVASDPIGTWRNNGLPATALPNADARINLEGGAQVVIRVHAPLAHRGVGIELYEVRPSALIVLEVIEHSPAGRAGIQPGDQIVAIGASQIADIDDAKAASELSLAADRRNRLTIVKPSGAREQVELDGGLVWLTM